MRWGVLGGRVPASVYHDPAHFHLDQPGKDLNRKTEPFPGHAYAPGAVEGGDGIAIVLGCVPCSERGLELVDGPC